MKFSYDSAGAQREAVAYIDPDGDLIIQTWADSGATPLWKSLALLSADAERKKPALAWSAWFPDDPKNKAVFYRGDTITITF